MAGTKLISEQSPLCHSAADVPARVASPLQALLVGQGGIWGMMVGGQILGSPTWIQIPALPLADVCDLKQVN